jgi:hypothetical protein
MRGTQPTTRLMQEGSAQLEAVSVGVVKPHELVVRAAADLTDLDAVLDQGLSGGLEVILHDDRHVGVPVVVLGDTGLPRRQLPQRHHRTGDRVGGDRMVRPVSAHADRLQSELLAIPPNLGGHVAHTHDRRDHRRVVENSAHHVSIPVRRLGFIQPSPGPAGCDPTVAAMTVRVSAGSITSSISRCEAVFSALPCRYAAASISA